MIRSRLCLSRWHGDHVESIGYIQDAPLDGEICDGCGAAAIIRVVLHTGGILVFCADCWTRHEKVLRDEAAQVRG